MAVFLGNAVALVLVVLLVAVCARELIQGHKNGGCSGGCAGCSGGCAGCTGSCSSCGGSCSCGRTNMTAGASGKGGGQL